MMTPRLLFAALLIASGPCLAQTGKSWMLITHDASNGAISINSGLAEEECKIAKAHFDPPQLDESLKQYCEHGCDISWPNAFINADCINADSKLIKTFRRTTQ